MRRARPRPAPPRSCRSASTSGYCPNVARASGPRGGRRAGRRAARGRSRTSGRAHSDQRSDGANAAHALRRPRGGRRRPAGRASAAAKPSSSSGAMARPRPRRSTRSPIESPAEHHRRQAGPEVVEHARAEGEARLEMVVMGAHADVGLEQVRLALGVGHPARVEVHAAPSRPRSRAKRDRLLGAGGHAAGSSAGRPVPRNTRCTGGPRLARRSSARIGVSGSSQRQTPPAQSSTRSSAPIPGQTPFMHRAVAPRRLAPGGRTAPRRRRRGRWGRRGSGRGRRARQPHAAEPEVALLLARADHEVGHRALAEHRSPAAAREEPASPSPTASSTSIICGL